MKRCSVKISKEAKAEFKEYLRYIKDSYKNSQAVKALKDDYDETIKTLSISAYSLPACENEKLRKKKLKKIHFQRHRYIMLFRVDENVATVVEIHHELEDYENKIK